MERRNVWFGQVTIFRSGENKITFHIYGMARYTTFQESVLPVGSREGYNLHRGSTYT